MFAHDQIAQQGLHVKNKKKESTMRDREFLCTECEAEFEIVHDESSPPEFCPFCGDKLSFEDDFEDEEWEEDE